MIDLEVIRDCFVSTPSRIVFLVVDGLGGVPRPETGRSELEEAHIPNLNALAGRSACGLTVPVLHGVTPGSGPGHLALFGYDPLKYTIGRGVLEALGIDAPVREGDVMARGNFCTVDAEGRVVDRRAGRIPNEENARLCQLLSQIRGPGVETMVLPVREHRFVLVLRGPGLDPSVADTDPQRTGVPALEPQALRPQARATARAVAHFVAEARRLLGDEPRANMVLLRGFSSLPHLPPMGEVYRLNPAAIAAYPMYRGLARVVGMTVLPTGADFASEVQTLKEHFAEHDFFFLHYKPADTAGEDGDFERKMRALQELDSLLPEVLALRPDVLVVAGDHSTPSVIGAHSWHPVPVMVHSRWTHGDGVAGFNERQCRQGSLGVFPATQLMLVALAHAGKLTKFGA